MPSASSLRLKVQKWCCGREAEGGGLLNRYTVEKPYRGFESLRHRHPLLTRGISFHHHRTAGDGGAGLVSGSLVRQNRRQPILGARRSRAIRGVSRGRGTCLEHVPSNPSGTATTLS